MHELFPENLRNPTRYRRAGAMRQFRSQQLDSIRGISVEEAIDLPGTRGATVWSTKFSIQV